MIEIQCEPSRYRIVDRAALADALGVALTDLASLHRAWVEEALREGRREREERWTESVAVGSRAFVEDVKRQLGRRGRSRVIAQVEGGYVLREAPERYGRDIAATETAPG